MYKICKDCQMEKEIGCFRPFSKGKYLSLYCRDCEKIRSKKYRFDNKERIKASSEKWCAKNKEKISNQCKIWWRKNLGNNRSAARLRYHANKEETNRKKKERRRLGLNGKEKEWYRNYQRQRRENPHHKLKSNLRHRLYMSLKGYSKSKSAILLLGCSIEEFKTHLESQFTQGMSWDNYGVLGWHVDHIIPCEAFDLTKEEEQRKCFHYSNLQPLWGTTEIAVKYGENSNYIGNLNKNDCLSSGKLARYLKSERSLVEKKPEELKKAVRLEIYGEDITI